jgi:formiminoglutamase
MSSQLSLFTQEHLQNLTATRAGETKLGETVQLVSSLNDLPQTTAHFVVLGIKEDIGIRANLGIGGATDCWDIAIKALLNVQSNAFLNGSEISVLGHLGFEDLLAEAQDLNASNADDLKKLRELTARIDSHVSETVEAIVKAGKVPIIIGGGHNNSYGNISGTSKALGKAINVLNIDPHTDYRAMEGRHSGNGFSYARHEGYLNKYAVYGLHEGYNGKSIIEQFQQDACLTFQTFEGLLSKTESERYQTFMDILNWCGHDALGLELDLDAITKFPVSALNPSGFTLNEVRTMVRATAGLRAPAYFHICEGSPERASSQPEKDMLGKSVAYLVTDFVKGYFS